MKGSSFKYLLKEGVRNIWSNRVMSFTSIAVLTTCLIIVGAAYLITANVNSMVGYVESQSEMVVFLKAVPKEEREAQKNTVEAEMKKIDNIKNIKYTSKEDGLENTKDMLGENGHLLDGLEDRNTLPDMFSIRVKDLALTKETVSELQKIGDVDIVQASNEVADTMTYIQRTISTFGSVLIIALGVISLVIISNTIRSTIFARRKEINIMKFVGATNSFIKLPFIVEGFMLGVVSSTVAFLIVWGSYTYLISTLTTGTTIWLQSAFESIIPFKDIALNLALFFVGTGTILGMIGSVVSVRNHAKV